MAVRYASWNIDNNLLTSAATNANNRRQTFFNFIAAVVAEHDIDILAIIETPKQHAVIIANQLTTACNNNNGTWNTEITPCETDNQGEAVLFLFNTDVVSPLTGNGHNIAGVNVTSFHDNLVAYPSRFTVWNSFRDLDVNAAVPVMRQRIRHACYMGFELGLTSQQFTCVAYHAPNTGNGNINTRYNQSYGLYLCNYSRETGSLYNSNAHAQLNASQNAIAARVLTRLQTVMNSNFGGFNNHVNITNVITNLCNWIYSKVLMGNVFFPYLDSERYDQLVTVINNQTRNNRPTANIGNMLNAYNLNPNWQLRNNNNLNDFAYALVYYSAINIMVWQEILSVASQGAVTQNNDTSTRNNIINNINGSVNWNNLSTTQPLRDLFVSLFYAAPTNNNNNYNIGDYWDMYSKQFYNNNTEGDYPAKTRTAGNALVSGDFNLSYPDNRNYTNNRYNVIGNVSGYNDLDTDPWFVANATNDNYAKTSLGPIDAPTTWNNIQSSLDLRANALDNICINSIQPVLQGYGWVPDIIGNIHSNDPTNANQTISTSASQLLTAVNDNNADVSTLTGAFTCYRTYISDHLPVAIDIMNDDDEEL